MFGTIVNTAAVAVGGIVGNFLRNHIKERFKDTILQGMALVVMVIGFSYAVTMQKVLIVIGSLALGGLCGEWWKIEDRLDRLGQRLQSWVGAKDGFARGFVNTSLVYCVGAMAITGAIQDGLTGNSSILLAKAMIDGVTAIVFASTMGLGVAFSAISVFVYQGTIALLAGGAKAFFTDPMIVEMTATGGVLIIGIGINMLNMARIRVGNLLPAVFIAPLLVKFYPILLKLLAF